MLIDNVLTLIEEYTAFKQLSRIAKAKKIAAARTTISPQQKADMQDSMKKDEKVFARRSAHYLADSVVPGLGTAASIASSVANLVKTSKQKQKPPKAPEILDLLPTNTIATAIKNTVQHAKLQRDDMQDSMERDGNAMARESARYIGDSIKPGLGTAGLIGSNIVNFVKKSASQKGLEPPEAPEIGDFIPTKTATTMIKHKLRNARSQYILDHLKSKADSEIQQGRVQKICAQNPGLSGC